MKKQYKIHCEFFVEAKDREEVLEILSWDTDFIENHIIIDETSGIKNDEIYNRGQEE